MIVLYLVGSNAAAAWSRGDWLSTIGLVLGTLALAAMAILIARWLGRRDLVDPQLVQAKISREACRIELRLAVFAPSFADPAAVADCLDGLAAAYQPFSLGSGNSLVPHSVRKEVDLRVLEPVARPCCVERARARGPVAPPAGRRRRAVPGAHYRPASAATACDGRPGSRGDACRIGASVAPGPHRPGAPARRLLGRHLLAVAKTRRGKSSLLLRLVQHLMQAGTRGSQRHRRIQASLHGPGRPASRPGRGRARTGAARAAGGRRLPGHVQSAAAVRHQPAGRRPWLGSRPGDANALRIFRREFDGFWGPRMEDAFRFAVLALFEANEAMCAADPRAGRGMPSTPSWTCRRCSSGRAFAARS